MAVSILEYFQDFEMDVWFVFALLSVPVIAICSSFLLKWARKRAKFVSMLNKLPHSKGNFLLGNLMEFMVSRVGLFEAKMKFGQRFKNEMLYCVWIGPSDVVVELTKAEAVEALLGSNRFMEKTKFHRYTHPWLGDGLLLSGGSEWHTRRKTLTPSFHYKILDGFVEVFNEQAIILVSKMQPYIERKKNHSYNLFDVYPIVSLCALDIICEKLETAMQKKINSQADGASEYVKVVNDTTKIIMERSMKPWLSFDWLFNLTSLGKEMKKNLAILHGFTDKVIAEKRQEYEQGKTFVPLKEEMMKEDEFEGKKKLAFLDTLLNCRENGQKLNEKTIRSEVDTFMFAGHDTTSCGIIWTLFLLGQYKYRYIHHKVHRELDAIFGDCKQNLTSFDLNDMKYLECVIKESLRLYPPVPHYGRSIDKDMHIAGYDIPGGITMMIHPYMVHRDPRYFPDPEAFDPDRFLPENSSKRPLYSYIPFSAGSRNCIGQRFAMMEMKTILAHILHKFLVTAVDSRDEIKIVSEVVLRPANGMRIIVEKRQSENYL